MAMLTTVTGLLVVKRMGMRVDVVGRRSGDNSGWRRWHVSGLCSSGLAIGVGVVDAAFAVTGATPLINPAMLAVAVIAPVEVAFMLIAAVPIDELVPLPVAAPVRVTVSPGA